MDRVSVRTEDRHSLREVTDQLRPAIPDGASGPCTVFVQHTTAGITVNEAEDRLLGDLGDALAALVPDEGWAHDRIDDNADAHVRAMLVGPSVTVPVADGAFALGTWQSLLLVECDGPRERTICVQPP